jgi:hypothetical protein
VFAARGRGSAGTPTVDCQGAAAFAQALKVKSDETALTYGDYPAKAGA